MQALKNAVTDVDGDEVSYGYGSAAPYVTMTLFPVPTNNKCPAPLCVGSERKGPGRHRNYHGVDRIMWRDYRVPPLQR